MEVLTKAEADRRIEQLILELRSSARVGRYWRKKAWDVLYGVICKEGPLVADGGPLSSLVFAALVGLAVEYLGEKPDLEHFADLRHVVTISMRGLVSVTQRTDQNYEEMEMIVDALRKCNVHIENIEAYCPASS